MPNPQEIREHVHAAARVAEELDGVVSRVSAAVTWNWDVPLLPPKPQITVPRNRKLSELQKDRALVRRMDLAPDQIEGIVTGRGRTVVDCLRWLPFPQGLCIADSALRHGVSRAELARLATGAKGPRSVKVRRVARHADVRAANVFESTLRAICLSVRGLDVAAQLPLEGRDGPMGTPDLVDRRLRILIEADSFEWHGHRSALVEDAHRYNRFVVNGWTVLRFTWEDVMLRSAQVREVLVEAVATASASLGAPPAA